MDLVTLGRTGLEVSVVGLGCGGHSRLGMRTGGDAAAAARLVRHAVDSGITLFDTAEGYGTEEAVGRGIEGHRDRLVLATKKSVGRPERLTPEALEESLNQSLRNLRTDRIDIYQLHAVTPARYAEVRDQALPVLQRFREEGKIRFLGITEGFGGDTDHQMLRAALADNSWDTIMVGFNLLNPSARQEVLPLATENNIGTLCMFAVRHALVDPAIARERLAPIVAEGRCTDLEILDELAAQDGGLTEAAYRFCRHEAGMQAILVGTGNPEHLDANIRALHRPPLPAPIQERLRKAFGHLAELTGN